MAFDKTQSPLRWLVLVLACASMFGSYYVYDNPTALQTQFQDAKEMNLDDTEYNLLYSVYSFPNIALPFFGGIFVDIWGTNVTMIVFLTLICIGQCIFALGCSLRNYILALMGRLIFGLGGESLSVAQSTLVAGWFRGKEVAFAMGVNLSIARVGSVVNDNVSPAAYNAWSLAWAIWLGFFICCMSLGTTIALVAVDRYAVRKNKEEEERKRLETTGDLPDDAVVEEEPPKPVNPVTFSEAFKKVIYDLYVDVFTFSTSYWLLLLSCLVVYSSILPFNGIAGDLIQKKYGYDSSEANRYLMIPFLISAICSPFLGGAVDYFGRRAILITASACFLILAHMLIGFVDLLAWIPMVIVGCSYCVYAAAMWPSVSYVVEPRTLGTAYGLITAVQNGGLAAVPLGVAAIKSSTGSGLSNPYRYVELFFAAFASLGVVTGVLLNIADARNGHVLNRSTVSNNLSQHKEDAEAPLLSQVAETATESPEV